MNLKFYLFGPPQITWNDSVLDFSRRQVRVLLYYLASYPNAIPRERLHYLFWNDESETVCRRNLSHLLTHARNALPDKSVLIVKDSLIMLDPEKIWCDVVEFNKLIQSAHKDIRLQVFKEAIEYYRGPFLDGVQISEGREFENLIELERFNLERKFLNLLYKLILIEKQRGNYEPAIEYAYQYLAIDNLSEEIHRQLIMVYGLAGNRERASAQYKICEDLLWQELQSKPTIKTQVAYQQALSETLGNVGNGQIQELYKNKMGPITYDPEYVSKKSLKRFTDVLDEMERAGMGGVAFVYGELGIGKSSLLTKVLRRYRKDRLIFRTRFEPGSHAVSYWPFKQFLVNNIELNQAADQESIGSLNTVHDFLDKPKAAQDDTNSSEYYFHLFTNHILSLAAAPGGFVLCLEDLEWADEDTLSLLLYLSRHLADKKLVILGSYCCEDNENLKEFLDNIKLSNRFWGTMKLEGIDLDETFTMVKYWIGEARDEEQLVQALHRISGGNPFFISELLRWLAESGVSVPEFLQSKQFSLPATISKVVDYRLSRLNQMERRVLEIAAVIGFSFKFDQIGNLSDLPIMQILDALDELVNRHLLVGYPDKYQFAHEILHQSVLDGMSPARRQFLEKSYLGDK